jgi:membrane protease YdiL (CAAX protease family)
MSRIHRSPFAFYLILAFGLCWLFWVPRALLSHNPQVPAAVLMPLQILGAFGPAAAALLTARMTGGQPALNRLLAPYGRWRVGAGWYALVLLYRPLIWAAALGIYLLLRPNTISWPAVDWVFFAAYALSQPLVVGIGEELGWMGFAYPWLRSRYRYLTSGLLLGMIWGLWHLPMFFTASDSQFGASLVVFVVKLTALRLVMALVFEATGSLVMPALFHVSINVLTELIPLSPNDPLAILLLIVVTPFVVYAYLSRKRAVGNEARALFAKN